MNRAVPILSLALSAVALALGITAHFRSLSPRLNEDQINALIAAQLDAREKAQVEIYAPRARQAYVDLLGSKFDPESFRPTTYAELFQPMILIFSNLTTQ